MKVGAGTQVEGVTAVVWREVVVDAAACRRVFQGGSSAEVVMVTEAAAMVVASPYPRWSNRRWSSRH